MMNDDATANVTESTPAPAPSAFRRAIDRWQRVPLYQRILIALVLGVITGLLLKQRAAGLDIAAHLIIRVLGALATPLILLAVMRSLTQAQLGRADAMRVGKLLVLNTLVAIAIGLLVANVMKPGLRAHVELPGDDSIKAKHDPLAQILDSIPDSVVRPFVTNNVIGVIILGVAFGLALRAEAGERAKAIEEWLDLAFRVVVRILHFVIAFVPLGVFGIVAGVVGTQGFAPFRALAAFIVAVLTGLFLQACWYLIRIRMGSWVRPGAMFKGMRDALVMAFSTDSSTATMPVTYESLVHRVGLREKSASLGALVGTNFNNDGTALYEAMSALFISQLIGQQLSLTQQLVVVVTAVLASVGAAGIPEAGLVTMQLVFMAVGLPTKYIALLLTVDWFLDRSRTVINVMGDINVSCLLDGQRRDK